MSFEPKIYEQGDENLPFQHLPAQNLPECSSSPEEMLYSDSQLTDSQLTDSQLTDFDLQMEDDLELLAEQLSDDAVYLSEKYPANPPSQFDADTTSPIANRNVWKWVSIAASLLILAGYGYFVTTNKDTSTSVTVNTEDVNTDINTTVTNPLATTVNVTSVKTSTETPAIAASKEAVNTTKEPLAGFIVNTSGNQLIGNQLSGNQPIGFQPQNLLLHLSAPEQEAFMDLLEEDQDSKTNEHWMYEISL